MEDQRICRRDDPVMDLPCPEEDLFGCIGSGVEPAMDAVMEMPEEICGEGLRSIKVMVIKCRLVQFQESEDHAGIVLGKTRNRHLATAVPMEDSPVRHPHMFKDKSSSPFRSSDILVTVNDLRSFRKSGDRKAILIGKNLLIPRNAGTQVPRTEKLFPDCSDAAGYLCR